MVTLQNLNNGGEVTYSVGLMSRTFPSGKISIVSLSAKALLGKEVDDEVAVQTPGGVKNYTVPEDLLNPHRFLPSVSFFSDDASSGGNVVH